VLARLGRKVRRSGRLSSHPSPALRIPRPHFLLEGFGRPLQDPAFPGARYLHASCCFYNRRSPMRSSST